MMNKAIAVIGRGLHKPGRGKSSCLSFISGKDTLSIKVTPGLTRKFGSARGVKTAIILCWLICWGIIPDLVYSQAIISPGIVINQENYMNYLSELKRLIPPGKQHLLIELGLKKGLITIPVVETTHFPHAKGFAEATKKNLGKCRIGPENTLLGWTAGLPFPNPKSDLEIAWNAYPEVNHGFSTDEANFDGYISLFNEDRQERSFAWLLRKKKYMGRTEFSPMPNMPEAETRGILSKESIVVTEPFDVKGFIQIRIRFWDLERDDDVYAYLPALRRIRRLTGRDVTDPLLGSDCMADDFEVWRQKPTPAMTFKASEGEFLVGRFYNEIWKEDFRRSCCFQHEWEIRPLWILEVTTNDPEYVYSKRVIFIDKEEGTYFPYGADNYDQRGRLYKSSILTIPYIEDKTYYRNFLGFVYLNNLRNHHTSFKVVPNFIPSDPAEWFSIRGLLRKVR